ncbi:TetR/AcrR family transcriptional regulator [Mycobacterium sp. E796]|uniref:TetR/AcrR family transcriptional regulator n=1 Tax=Mycobacterium sp. E796 TaxID=1834151 RepID=UPI0007FD774C|nr:TetR/AcrR family transcriptional regulator [Mycobacterium sp. E796]OBI51255.1 TetR family transcriptional regulator [Mycobacterium sp. E796]
MAQRSDSRDRMIAAARGLFREHGYLGTALSDVIEESAAPRGSLYFHFPGGKEELATEVVLRHTSEVIAHVNRVAGATTTAADLIAGFLKLFRDEIVSSDYRRGCAVAPIVIESTPASQPLSDVTRRGFGDVIATLAARLEEKGVSRERAHDLATLAVTTMEGALILSRTLRSPKPFETAITTLTAAAQAATDATA